MHRIRRHLNATQLLVGKTLATLNFKALPTLPRKTPTDVMLHNGDGGIEALFTAMPVARDRILLIGDIEPQRRDLGVLTNAVADWPGALVVDMTSAFAMIELIGPSSESALRAAGWRAPNGTIHDPQAEIGLASWQIAQTRRFGLPAWNLIAPSDRAGALCDALAHIALLGSHARHALLTAAGTPIWGQALSPSIGVQSAAAKTDAAPTLRKITLAAPEPVLLGQEIVRIGGRTVGTITQAAYALGVETAIGLGMIARETSAHPCPCDVQIAGAWHPAHAVPVDNPYVFANVEPRPR